jgi:4-alpha-glucanotransferase
MLPCAEDLGVVPACSYETLKQFSIPGMDVQRWARDWGKTFDFRKAEEYRHNSIAVISSHDMNPLMAYWEEEAGTVDAGLVAKTCGEKGFDLNWVQGCLFNMAASSDKRLRWKKEIDTPDRVLLELGKSRDQAWMFYDMHRESYTEKEKFWEYLGLPGMPKEKADKAFVKAALQKAAETKSIFSIQIIHDWLSISKLFDKWKRTEMRINVPGSISDNNWSIVLPVSLEQLLEDEKTNEEIRKINMEGNRI